MYKGWDWGDILSYQTLKVVKVKDVRLGIIYYVCGAAIVVYLVFQLVVNQGYLQKEPPVPGAVRVSLKAPTALQTPAYCNQTGCLYWSGDQIIYPSDQFASAFLTTRVSIVNFTTPPGCDPTMSTTPECSLNAAQVNKSLPMYIADIESYTLMIEHSIRGKATDIAIRNGIMDGTLVAMNGTTLRTFTNSSRLPTVDGDILTVGELLVAAGANLDTPSYAPSAKGETCRSSGIVIVVVINYANVFSDPRRITYQYLPQFIVGNEYKVEELINTANGVIALDRHGIKLIFQQSGQIGVFNFVTLILNFVAGLALLKVATILVELLMLRFLPQRDKYEAHKYEETGDILEPERKDGSGLGGSVVV